ncbi:MAG TPA: DUF2891 domain-containing protein [Thermomicrobiales bacterium]|nr:DUF2891 domain-containing protein [Thermomicrobiales bacterium]
MTFDRKARLGLLREHATDYVDVAIRNIQREFPHMPYLVATAPGPYPGHRELHPAFFGSFDWHSCVEMYWVAIRLVRLFPDAVNDREARETISSLLTPEHIATEIAFFTNPNHGSIERPYGWGWLLTLMHELECWKGDSDAERWTVTLRPLADVLAGKFITWLPKLAYPQRTGMHANTAFGLLRSLDVAESKADMGDARLRDAIHEAARRFFEQDIDYPAHYEPSGADFLSAALAEAELMGRLMKRDAFATWLEGFLPGLGEGRPASLFMPATVSDESDGQIAHLAGLNLSRGASFVAISESLPQDDSRIPHLLDAAERHGAASLPSVSGSDYMVEHWLAAYATLLLG